MVLTRPVNKPPYLQVIDFCHDILNYIVTISKTFPKAAVKFCLDMQIMLHYDTYESKWTVAIVEVARQIERILAELGPTSYSGLIQAIRQADSLIKDEKPYEAERLCQQVIDANELTGSWELESKRILLEALVLQKKWSIALTVSSEYKRLFGSSNFFVSIAVRSAHNVGYRAAFVALTEGDKEAGDFLKDLLSWPLLGEVQKNFKDGSPARICLLSAICDLLKGEASSAQAMLSVVRPSRLSEGSPTETRSWCALWQLASLATLRLAYISVQR